MTDRTAKERPILFSGPMVRAILAGRKTQTRRAIKKPEKYTGIRSCGFCCPYGQRGERLWVRETFARSDFGKNGYLYRADGDLKVIAWTPSIHIPRVASRINLEITGVRVETLQEISANDILAEGAVLRAHDDQFGHNPVSAFDEKVYLDLKSLWSAGWEKINGKGSWSANPWVWVVEFLRVPA